MQIHDLLNNVFRLLWGLQRASESAGKGDESALWHHVRMHVVFTITTGQVYVFEDYLADLDPAHTAHVTPAFNVRADTTSQQAMSVLLGLFDTQTESTSKLITLVIIDLLNFFAINAQYEAFESYLKNFHSSPPHAIAYFDTREEAEAWLNNLAEPPSGGHVLIGDEYYELWYSREDGFRELLRDRSMAWAFEVFESKPLPPATASFDTREEAMAWLTSHPASRETLITIAGEYYHAAYHRNLNRHTLHSLSRLREDREKLKAEQEQQEDAEAEPSEE
ncbi:hypothetical protein F0U59_33430 [Archangium gephyra]|nr:hypothetical protein F0U59_33430 [Archangium gephyra]